MIGYVKAYRSRFSHDLFRASKTNPFCRGFAWDWMVARACWQTTTYDIRGKTVTLERGQFVASPEEMAAAWGWSRAHVRRFLSRLQSDLMIGQETGQQKTIITICNYEKYQSDDEREGRTCGHNIGHKSATNRPAKEEGKERKKEESPNGDSLEGRRRARKPEVAIPENWIPSERNVADAVARNFSQQDIEREADRFRNHHLAKGSMFRDWDAAWRKWLGNSQRFNGSGGMAGGAIPIGRQFSGSMASIAARRRAEGKV